MIDVYLSPSVQEHNLYATGGTEEQIMQMVGDVVGKDFKASGVTFERNTPDMTLSQIIARSNALNPKVHMAIHSNAGGTNSRGTTAFYHLLSSEGKKLTQMVYDKVAEVTPVTDRGIKSTLTLAECRATTGRACLVEVDFHDNIAGADFIKSHIEEFGHAVAAGVCQYLGKTHQRYDATPPIQATVQVLPAKAKYPGVAYRYIKGTVMKGANVKAIQVRLRTLGFYLGALDSSFGPATDKAVRAFQKSKGISQDGSVGPITWSKLF